MGNIIKYSELHVYILIKQSSRNKVAVIQIELFNLTDQTLVILTYFKCLVILRNHMGICILASNLT